jgi:hypothetical protein
MLIRWLHYSILGATAKFGRFDPLMTPDQSRATAALYLLFLESEGLPEDSQLQKLSHSFFDTILRAEDLGDRLIACPSDLTLFLTSLLPDGNFRSANFIVTLCCMFRYFFRSTFIHILRLASTSRVHYLPFQQDSSIQAEETFSPVNEDPPTLEEIEDEAALNDPLVDEFLDVDVELDMDGSENDSDFEEDIDEGESVIDYVQRALARLEPTASGEQCKTHNLRSTYRCIFFGIRKPQRFVCGKFCPASCF